MKQKRFYSNNADINNVFALKRRLVLVIEPLTGEHLVGKKGTSIMNLDVW